MMTVLNNFLLSLLTKLLESAAGAFRAWADQAREEAAIRRTARAERDATEKAQTEEERTHAADNNRRL